MWIEYNANPIYKRTGDCVVRAISKALCQEWETTFTGLCVHGLMFCDMPSSNAVWGSYLAEKGFKRKVIENSCQCYTVEEFCKEHPKGNYILGTGTHAIAVLDGDYFDTWQSGQELPIYYYERKED